MNKAVSKCNGCAECTCCGRSHEKAIEWHCDVCGEETNELYETNNGQECRDCIMKRETKAHQLPYEGECHDCGDYCGELFDYVGVALCRYCFEEAVLGDLEKVDTN